ncbi:MAG TPA: hypothetical protein VKA21_08735 [Candidatus Binatia bacterium]|nr:hypothetical protein [Candidatus Binatia bacterium]
MLVRWAALRRASRRLVGTLAAAVTLWVAAGAAAGFRRGLIEPSVRFHASVVDADPDPRALVIDLWPVGPP